MTDAAKPLSAARPPEGAKAPLGGSAAHAVASVGAPLLPGSTLGVLGGGQLGRMFVHQAQAMGYFTAVLDADPTTISRPTTKIRRAWPRWPAWPMR